MELLPSAKYQHSLKYVVMDTHGPGTGLTGGQTDVLVFLVIGHFVSCFQVTSEILVRSGMLYRDADSEDVSEVFTESGLENGLSEEPQHTGSGTAN